MTLMPIVYVTDMTKATSFYTALGADISVKSRSGGWTELSFGDATLALHRAEELPKNRYAGVELCFNAAKPLEHLVQRLTQAGVQLHQNITDEAFGRSLQIMDPDGLILQVNEHDTTLYAEE